MSIIYKAKDVQPSNPAVVPTRLCKAFTTFLLNGGYQGFDVEDHAEFKKPKSPSIHISLNGVICKQGQKQYALFLQIYLRTGANFLERLNRQANMAIRSGKAGFKFIDKVAA